jgi:hypothetical protein
LLPFFCISSFGLYSISKNIYYLTVYEYEQAEIISCERRIVQSGGAKGKMGGSQPAYTPVAKKNNGIRIKGTLYYGRKQCTKAIGLSVGTLANPNNSKDGYLLTFVQFWLVALLLTFVPMVFLFMFFLLKKK